MAASRRWVAGANWVILLGLLASLWLPLWWRHRIHAVVVTPAEVEAARSTPDEAARERARSLTLAGELKKRSTTETLARANDVLEGRLALAGRPAVQIRSDDWWADPFQDPTWQLELQSLEHARTLLTAWSLTRRPEYLERARDIVLSWIGFDRWWPFGGGFMWNDHAAAARAVTIATLWDAYSSQPGYEPVVGSALVTSLAKHAGFLLDPRHFTFNSNHGVIQSVALLHVSTMLPILAERSGAVDVAVRRITQQYRLLASPEGLWTEHSPGYQLFAVNLLRDASRSLGLLGRPVPEEWSKTLSGLESGLVQLARRDGSLPQIGDTLEVPGRGHLWPEDLMGRVAASQRDERFVAPCAGYAVLWETGSVRSRRTDRQVVATVSNFAGQGHKHADELSVYVFAGKRSWLTGPGYWPYASPRRAYAVGWTGANAPSFDGEPEVSERTAEIVGFGHAPWGDVVEMRRRGPMGFTARRQLVWLRPDWLVVADSVTAPEGRRPVVRWLLSPGTSIEGSTGHGWIARATSDADPRAMRVWVLSDVPADVSVAQGAQQPFLGWVSTSRGIEPAPAFEIIPRGRQALVVTIAHLASEAEHAANPETPRLTAAGEAWALQLGATPGTGVRVEAKPSSVKVVASGVSSQGESPIEPVICPDNVRLAHAEERKALEAEFGSTSISQRPSVPMTRYRQVTAAVIGVALLQEAALALLGRRRPRLVLGMRLSACLTLVIVGLLLFLRWGGANVV